MLESLGSYLNEAVRKYRREKQICNNKLYKYEGKTLINS
jgi:hypothetical protein